MFLSFFGSLVGQVSSVRNCCHEGTVVSIEDAIRLNASGVAYSILVGAEFERDTILGDDAVYRRGGTIRNSGSCSDRSREKK